MANRRPLVNVSGTVSELPAGDAVSNQTIGTTAPSSPADGDQWYDTSALRENVRYGAWAEAARGVMGLSFDLDGGASTQPTTVNWTQNNVLDFGGSV